MQYASKLLLFGEHTINRGSHALAIPYAAFGGQWAYSENVSKQQNLLAFANYLENLQQEQKLLATLDLPTFKKDLSEGLFFDSNIPVGYGLGSSGALCAAVYDRFCEDKTARDDAAQFSLLRNTLAQMECFFHGFSSGTDPLICYLNQTVLIQATNAIEIVDLPSYSALTFFLLDTGVPRSTEPLVQYFLNRCENVHFSAKIKSHLVWQTNHAIGTFLSAQWELFFEHISEISRFQLSELPDMTPAPFHKIWQEGLESDIYRLKMCGAGGGGFILGISKDWAKTRALLQEYNLSKIIW